MITVFRYILTHIWFWEKRLGKSLHYSTILSHIDQNILISGTFQQQRVNVAVGKATSILRTDNPAVANGYHKWGGKDNLVDGLRTATGSGSGCTGCFASNNVEGYWQVDLGQKYFVAYITIVGVTGEHAPFTLSASACDRMLLQYLYDDFVTASWCEMMLD